MIVFAGPSLAGLDRAGLAGFDLRPPVQQGDVFLAMRDRPAAIGIIDGYFDGVPAVWHKEILFAMSQGTAVLGAASMGALRAAELDAFGMTGVGDIYAGFRDGTLEDDDEVALVHGPAELGYPALSVAMVNVRATLDTAVAGGVVDATQAQALVVAAKAQFYQTRTWHSILGAAPQDLPLGFADWVADHAVDLKQRDACALLQVMRDGAYPPARLDVHFEYTDLWHQATRSWTARDKRPKTGYHGQTSVFDL